MSTKSLRRAQLVSPFGVGALCEIDGQSFFVKGTHRWPKGKNLKEVKLQSLTGKLHGVSRLMRPEYAVSVTRFPRWHFCPGCRGMVQWTSQDDRHDDDKPLPVPRCKNTSCKNRALVPMRFVAVCDNGHVDEIDWYYWAHRGAQQARTGSCSRAEAKLTFKVTGRSGGDFKSMHVACSCGAKNSLEGISERPLLQGCKGYQPGEGNSGCTGEDGRPSKMWMEPRGSSALHYPSVISALDIAQASMGSALATKLAHDTVFENWVNLATRQVKSGQLAIEQLESFYKANLQDIADEHDAELDDIWAIFLERVAPGDDDTTASGGLIQEFDQRDVMADEFPVLGSMRGFQGANLTTVAHTPPSHFALDSLLERVVQVERLREVRVFRGFQRRDVGSENSLIPPDLGTGAADWLPAIEVSGEGIFLQFKNEAIASWLDDNGPSIDEFTASQLRAAEEADLPRRMGFNANPAFIMLHTFAHMLINQLSFDCGYSSTSLRERVYCGPESNLYCGILIYTADSDSEGSMGGLVEMGGPERIAEVIYRSVAKSEWCSGDPVCRELESQGIGNMNRAACHACSLVAETSCTYSNILLNRVLVSGRGSKNGRGVAEPFGFFHKVIEGH
ncbi:DUF1998 domain-containing protein [Actibacterium pelagium]|uniref:MrfA-like Zn-binding domain-containing protein n=1 Tax=Actibacterium pelagium TaxID=2029103 RepID=A0A917AJF0_9RHOB|nr:DUF1998 domain-containing protein [Actibacterium pelagium]GGE57417.1 hypothetical protein GCM10011517_26510 [Actibacterium pelagium]